MLIVGKISYDEKDKKRSQKSTYEKERMKFETYRKDKILIGECCRIKSVIIFPRCLLRGRQKSC